MIIDVFNDSRMETSGSLFDFSSDSIRPLKFMIASFSEVCF